MDLALESAGPCFISAVVSRPATSMVRWYAARALIPLPRLSSVRPSRAHLLRNLNPVV
jgi:hypothetical protein